LPVYLKDDDEEKVYWRDVEKQKKVKLWKNLEPMTTSEIISRVLWLVFCFALAVAVGGRSCGI
jgi:hypothetical protein